MSALISLAVLVIIGAVPAWLERRRGSSSDRGRSDACWIDTVESDDRFLYGRSHCFDEGLQEMDARARRGEFDTITG